MPSRQYDTGELILECDLDSILWLEVAQRHAKRHQPQAFEALVAFRRELQEEGVRLASSVCDPCDREQVEEAYADLVFDRAQYGDEGPLRYLPQDAVGPFVASAPDRILFRITELEGELQCATGFTLADFSVENDIRLLLHWWTDVIIPKQPHGHFNTMFRVTASPDVAREFDVYEAWESYSLPARRPVTVAPSDAKDKSELLEGGLAPVRQFYLERHYETRAKRLFKQHDGVKRKMLAMLAISERETSGKSQTAAIEEVLNQTGQQLKTGIENVRVAVREMTALIESYRPEMLPWRTSTPGPTRSSSG